VDLGFLAVPDVIDVGDLGLDVLDVAEAAVEVDLDRGLLEGFKVLRTGLAGPGRLGGRGPQGQAQD